MSFRTNPSNFPRDECPIRWPEYDVQNRIYRCEGDAYNECDFIFIHPLVLSKSGLSFG